MSKIQSVTSYQNKPNLRQKQTNFAQNTNFGGANAVNRAQEIMIDRALTDYLGLGGKFIDWMSSTTGEVQNILVMNLGTAFVAPLFIANNPISKDDKNTKAYAAWRQPISAVIALAFGLGINIPVAKYLDSKVTQGELEKFDLSAQPPSEYIKVRYNGIKRHFNHLKGADKEYFDMVKDGETTSVKAFVDKFPTYNEFKEAVHGVTLKKAAIKLLNKDNPKGLYNQTLKDFLIENLKFEEDYVDKSILNPDLTEKLLSKIKAMDFLREVGYKDEEVDEKSLRTFLNDNYHRDKVDLDSKIRKIITRSGESLIPEEMKNAEKITLERLFKNLKIDYDFYKHEFLNKKMHDFLLWLDDQMKIKSGKINKNLADAIEKSFKNRLEEFAMQIAKNAANKASINYGAFKKILGIVLSLMILPFSCGLLNWAYPKIMKKCFPNLCKKPEDKADNKGGK